MCALVRLKSKVEICKLPSTTPVFLSRYREARKLPPSPRWSPSQGIPHKGQAPGRVTPWIASGLPHAQVGLRRAFRQASSGCSPPSSLSSFRQNGAGLVPSGTRWWPHHKRGWCDLARLQAPLMYNSCARKHGVARDMQTSLNTRHIPRASA